MPTRHPASTLPAGLILCPEHPSLEWRTLDWIARELLETDARTVRAWGDTYAMPIRKHGKAWYGVLAFVAAMDRALTVERYGRRFGGWHGAGDTAAARGLTFRSAWGDWCGSRDVLPWMAAAGFALAATKPTTYAGDDD